VTCRNDILRFAIMRTLPQMDWVGVKDAHEQRAKQHPDPAKAESVLSHRGESVYAERATNTRDIGTVSVTRPGFRKLTRIPCCGTIWQGFHLPLNFSHPDITLPYHVLHLTGNTPSVSRVRGLQEFWINLPDSSRTSNDSGTSRGRNKCKGL
jgi:hypothetical protein